MPLLRFTLLLAALSTAGCGFHLRGESGIPQAWQPVHIASASPNGDLHREVERELRLRGVELTSRAGEAVLRLTLQDEALEQRTVSLDSGARVAEFAFFHRIDLELRNAQGDVLAGPQSVQVRRVIINDPDNPVGEEAERSLLHNEMEQDLAGRIVDRLTYWSRSLQEEP